MAFPKNVLLLLLFALNAFIFCSLVHSSGLYNYQGVSTGQRPRVGTSHSTGSANGRRGYGYGHIQIPQMRRSGTIYATHQQGYGHVEAQPKCPCKQFVLGQGHTWAVNGVQYDTVVSIGQGTQSIVYHAHHGGTCYAIKDNAPEIEYDALSACSECANVVRLYDAQKVGKYKWRLVLELAEMTLGECLDDGLMGGELILAHAQHAVLQIKEKGYSHNDVNFLGNWMLFKSNGQRVIKLTDFGKATTLRKKNKKWDDMEQLFTLDDLM